MKKVLKVLCTVIATVLLCCGIAGCTQQEFGTFYTLEEAYEAEFLTRDDLMSIAYYHNGGREYNETVMNEEYTPIEKSPEILDAKILNEIKETAARELRSQEHSSSIEVTAEDFELLGYYGKYKDCLAIMIRNIHEETTAEIVNYVTEIDGVKIHYTGHYTIVIYRDNMGEK